MQADVVHFDDDGHDAVHRNGEENGDNDQDDQPRHERLTGHLVEGDHHDLGGQHQVGPDRPGHQDILGRRRRVGVIGPRKLAHTFSAPS